jgi:hypothetical protein
MALIESFRQNSLSRAFLCNSREHNQATATNVHENFSVDAAAMASQPFPRLLLTNDGRLSPRIEINMTRAQQEIEVLSRSTGRQRQPGPVEGAKATRKSLLATPSHPLTGAPPNADA